MIPLAPGVVVSESELVFRATRSGGPGGQNVNKVATRIELIWDVAGSPSLDEAIRARLLKALATRLDGEGRLRIVASEERSQSRNRELALERLAQVITEALKPRKKRRPTKPTKGSKQRRLKAKRVRSDRKRDRRPPRED